MLISVQGVSVPALGFGTWPMRGAECQKAVETALEIGYRHLDTAQLYDNEEAVGAAVRASGIPRDQIWVTTKIATNNMSAEAVRSSTASSLERLGLGPVDLLLIHWPSSSVSLEETLSAMDELRRAGSVRHLGVSNFSPTLLEQAMRIAPILCNQVEHHPYYPQDELKALARQHDQLFVAYSPVARGRVDGDHTLIELGRKHGKTPAQVTLRWLIQQPNVSAIPKASQRQHIQQNFEIFDFALSDSEMQQIDALGKS